MKIDKPIASQTDAAAASARYVLGDCLLEDERATMQSCDLLKDHVEYLLLSNNILGEGNDADRVIGLTITYYNDGGAISRAMLGLLAGKEGMDVLVKIIDRQSDNVIGSASVSHYNFTGGNYSEEMMANRISSKVIEYVTDGKAE